MIHHVVNVFRTLFLHYVIGTLKIERVYKKKTQPNKKINYAVETPKSFVAGLRLRVTLVSESDSMCVLG